MDQVTKYFIALPFLVQLDSASLLFPIGAAVFALRFLNRELKVFFAYQIIAFMITIWMTYLASRNTNNLWLVQIQTPIELGFFMWVFSAWQLDAFVKRFYRLTIPAFACLWGVLAIFVEKQEEFNTISKPTEAILLIIASAYSLYQVNREKLESLFKQPSFWISSGTLIYFAGTVIFFAVTNLLLRQSPDELRTASFAVFIMNTVANLLYAGGFLCKRLTPA